MKYLKLKSVVLIIALFAGATFSSCSDNLDDLTTNAQAPKTTLGLTHQQKVQAFAHRVVYDFLMNIDFNPDLVETTSEEQLKADIKGRAKSGGISRKDFADVLNQDLGISRSSTNSIFSFVERNQQMISTIGKDEFTDAMEHEFELLQENPPKKTDGWIADIFEAVGWGNDPCTGKQIAYTLDVLIDGAELALAPETGGLTAIDGAESLGSDLYHAYQAYANCR